MIVESTRGEGVDAARLATRRVALSMRKNSVAQVEHVVTCSNNCFTCSGDRSSRTARYKRTVAQTWGPYSSFPGIGGKSVSFIVVAPPVDHLLHCNPLTFPQTSFSHEKSPFLLPSVQSHHSPP